MSTTRDPKTYLAVFQADIKSTSKAFQTEYKAAVVATYADLVVNTSGVVPHFMLAKLDHPYAKRHGASLLPLLPINMDTGRLAQTRKLLRVGLLEYHMSISVPYAPFVLGEGGTRFTLDRGLLGRRGLLEKNFDRRIKNIKV